MHMGWLSEELLLALLLDSSPGPRSPVPRRPAFVRHAAPRLLLLLFGTGLVLGCASSESAQSSPEARAAAIGAWKYKVDGVAPLDRGTFQITKEGGRLQALLRDRQQGRLRARVDLRDSRLKLVLDDFRISGQIEDETFTGVLRRRQWNVDSHRQRRSRSQFRSAPLQAQRVRSASAADEPRALNCRSILREADGCS